MGPDAMIFVFWMLSFKPDIVLNPDVILPYGVCIITSSL